MFLESRQRWYSTGFQDTHAISVKRRAVCQGKVQRNSKKVSGRGEEVLQTLSSQSGWKRTLTESRGLCCISVCARVHVCTFNCVLWLGARPKISGSTIVTLMQSGMVATTGPVVNSKESSIFLCPFLFLLRILNLKQCDYLFFFFKKVMFGNQMKRQMNADHIQTASILLSACLSYSNLGNYTGQ